MSATDALIHAAAMLERTAAIPNETDTAAAILSGLGASQQPIPADARDAARRHLAIAEWLRSYAKHETAERADALLERAAAQELMAAITLAHGPRLAA